MIVRALDSSGDWSFGKGLSDYVQDRYAIAQNIKTNVSSFLGDCFFDLGAGIDWFGNQSQIERQLAIAAVILNTKDNFGNQAVTGILQLSINLNSNRLFQVAYQVNTIYSILANQFSLDLGGTNGT